VAKGGIFRIAGCSSALIAVALGVSYCSELPKYRFEQRAAETIGNLPGARTLGTSKSPSFSPVSWLRPATTTWEVALPDARMADRFYMIKLVYGAKPMTFLIDADCQSREQIAYDLDEPDSAIPARDLFGAPVVAANARTYRRPHAQPDLPAAWLTTFCDTDWSAERETLAVRQKLR
jgi:hypothetical protein